MTKDADPGSSSGGSPTPTPDGSGTTETTFYCDVCGSEMLNLHCKLICQRCGYKRDCSDP